MGRILIARIFGLSLKQLGRALDRLPRPFLSRTGQAAIDGILSALAIWLAHELRFDFSVPAGFQMEMWAWVLLLPVLQPLCIWATRGYTGIWRYFNLDDALTLVLAAVPAAGLLFIFRVTMGRMFWLAAIPRAAILMEFCGFVLLALGARALRRVLYEASRRNGDRIRTLLVGTEEGLASALRQVSLFPDIVVIGLLTTNPELHGSQLAGFPVMNTPSDLPQQLASGNVDFVLIADADVDCIGKTVATAMEFGVDVRLLPSAQDVISGDMRVSTIPKPSLAINGSDDSRQPHPAVVESFRDRVVLITGAGGSIGSELSRQVAKLPVARLLLLDQDENSIFEINGELSRNPGVSLIPLVADIRDRGRIWSVFAKYKPQIVLHAAAYKHVPVMEHNCSEAVLNNVLGTRTVAEAAMEFGAERFLMISTDKAVNPSSVMGATKRMAELLIQDLSARQRDQAKLTRCACVRFGNVLGSRGSVVPLFLRQIANGGPLTITDEEMTRYFMTIPEAVQLVLQAASLGSNGEIYMLDMGDPVKIMDMARRLIEMSGLRPGEDIPINIVGARPGEKLHEQLWGDTAKVTQTSFSRVLRIQPAPAPPDFDRHLQALEAAAFSRNDDLTRTVVKQMPINYGGVPIAKMAAKRAAPVATGVDKAAQVPQLAPAGA